MLNVSQFREHLVTPTLTAVGLYSPSARQLVMGTAFQESGLKHLMQIGGGPAVGLFQMEPATHDDIWENYLRFKPLMNRRARLFSTKSNIPGSARPDATEMMWNLKYAIVMCRLHYYRVRFALPEFNDLPAQAKYWKNHYNTQHGAGTIDEYIESWRHVMERVSE